MQFHITDGLLQSIEGTDYSFEIPADVHTIGAGALIPKGVDRTDRIVLPDTVYEFENGKYDSGISVNEGTIVSFPASVYQLINNETFENSNCSYPNRDYEFRCHIIKSDGTCFELYLVYKSDYDFLITNLWEIPDVNALSENDFSNYDATIDTPSDCYGKRKTFTVDQKVRVRLSRLLHPFMLSTAHRSEFVKFICSHAKEAFTYALEHDDTEMLQLLIDIKAINAKNATALFPLLAKADAHECRKLWDSVACISDAETLLQKEKEKKDEKERQFIIEHGVKSDQIDPRRKADSMRYHVISRSDSAYQYTVTGGHDPYTVSAFDGFFCCTCMDFQKQHNNCKHIIAVRAFLNDPALVDNTPEVVSRLGRSASAEEKLADVVSQLKEKYKGKDIYSKYVIELENPGLKWDTFNSWSKKVTGMPADEYLISLGIMKKKIWFQIRTEDIEAEDLKGKAVCVLDEFGNTIPALNEILEEYGAIIASPDAQNIDFLCLQRGISKDPRDRNEAAYSLLEKLEKGQLSFSVLGPDFTRKVYRTHELNRKKTPEEREALGLRISNRYPYSQNPQLEKTGKSIKVTSKVSLKSLPLIDDDTVYWTLRQFREWFQISGGSIRPGTKTYRFSEKESFATPDQVRNELAKFKMICSKISSPSVEQYIIDHSVKKKDGSLYKGRLQIVAPFKYTGENTCYHALIARNISDNEIVVSFEERNLRNYDDMDYEWDHKLDECIDGIDPSLLWIAQKSDNNVNYLFRNAPGYIYVESSSGKISDGAFAGDDLIQYVEVASWTTAIGRRAFANCKNLKEIAIPNNLESMASDAFEGCPDNLVIHKR